MILKTRKTKFSEDFSKLVRENGLSFFTSHSNAGSILIACWRQPIVLLRSLQWHAEMSQRIGGHYSEASKMHTLSRDFSGSCGCTSFSFIYNMTYLTGQQRILAQAHAESLCRTRTVSRSKYSKVASRIFCISVYGHASCVFYLSYHAHSLAPDLN